MTLAEIIREGEDAEQAYRDAKAFTAAEIGAADACHVFYVANGPRLLAVAKAAVEHAPQIEGFCREAEATPRPPGGQQAGMDRSWACRVPPSVIGEVRWYARDFRELLAAVRGEGKEKATGPCATGHDWIRRGEGSAGNKYVCLRCGEQKP